MPSRPADRLSRIATGQPVTALPPTRTRRATLLLLLVAMATACSAGPLDDPIFGSSGSARPAGGDCPAGSTCIEVAVEGLVEAAGRRGRCEIYTTPGDPATMEPLVSEDVEVPEAGGSEGLLVPFVWEVTIPVEVDPGDLNPVCSPMAEG